MKLYELTFQYHKELNPKLWRNGKLKPEVVEKLQEIGNCFFDFIDVPNLKVVDIVMTGSLANYNWTQYSDIDLHLIVEKGDHCEQVTAELFDAKKDVWANKYDIDIHGFPVEVYVQDSEEPHVASGVYSVKNNKWIVKPKNNPPKVDKIKVDDDTKEFNKEIDTAIASDISSDKAREIKDKIKNSRDKALKKDGEFASKNLTFKELRNTGVLSKLIDYIKDKESEELSLK